MQIIVTGDYMFNSGDVSWLNIEEVEGVTVTRYEATPPELVVERCVDADIILNNKTPITAQMIAGLPRLKLISMLATGYNMIDTAAAKDKGIIVCNVPAYGTASVAQHTFALILELTNHVALHAQSVASGGWVNNTNWCYSVAPINGLEGKTMGIVGFGNIGRQVSVIAEAFGMKVVYYSFHKKENTSAAYVSLEKLFAESDVVSLHCPATAGNNKFVNRQLIELMKPSALLINTSRGQLINEDDLAYALNNDIIAGAGLDVLSVEPPLPGNPMFGAKNCLITPHIAWLSREARQRILDITALNIRAFLDGKPVNAVN
ncbi:MAG TPA: D-2-hydroxyacid dehydrogenase [Chitinophagaceae bacterium]|nr:D-2-hydroxyacid dehydrogenase [Chitinophagaceae bacterium]